MVMHEGYMIGGHRINVVVLFHFNNEYCEKRVETMADSNERLNIKNKV